MKNTSSLLYVRAYDEIINDSRFATFSGDAQKTLRITDFPASDIFGPNFQARLKGYDRNGNPTVFGPNTKIVAIFKKASDGTPELLTMYPNP